MNDEWKQMSKKDKKMVLIFIAIWGLTIFAGLVVAVMSLPVLPLPQEVAPLSPEALALRAWLLSLPFPVPVLLVAVLLFWPNILIALSQVFGAFYDAFGPGE